jgi:hypothetical protein
MIITVWLFSALMLAFMGFGIVETIGLMCIAHFLTLFGIRIWVAYRLHKGLVS